MPKRPLNDHEQETLSKLAQHLGNPLDEFDMGVANWIEKLVHEGNYRKMHAAQTGGASEPMGPSDIDLVQVKQRSAGVQAAQAQAGQSAPNAPPASSGPVGTNQPYPAQAGPQPEANVQQPSPGAQASPPPAAPAGEDEEEG
jgi:hypothetical protein